MQTYTKILLGMLAGVVLGWALGPDSPLGEAGGAALAVLRPVGLVFMRLIQMVIVPLVFASLVVGVASLGDLRKLGRVGLRTLALYLATTAVAVTIGLMCATLINPGGWMDATAKATLVDQFGGGAAAKLDQAQSAPAAVDTLLAMVPTNPMAAMAQGDMLAVIFFALAFGSALTLVPAHNKDSLVKVLDQIQQVMIVLIDLIMKLAPYGVAALVADVVASSGLGVLQSLLGYSLAVVVGLALHVGLVYGPMVRALAGVGMKRFFIAARRAQLIAFSTSSSSATLPVTLECAEEELGVSNSVASFVIPLGATVNMDGTALYQGVAAVFIAQVFDMDLSIQAQLGIVLTATFASIGAAGVPGAGMITLAMVLTNAGIPTVGIALILGADRLLDMFRTAVNVTGDLAVTVVVARAEGETVGARGS